MKQINEVTLMAYADGELSANEALAVEHAIVGDASLRARVDSYRRSAESVREAYEPIAKEACPAALSAAIGKVPGLAADGDANKSWPRRHWRPLAASIAAAVVVGVLILSLRVTIPVEIEKIVGVEPGERSVPVPVIPGRTASADATVPGVVRIGAPAPDVVMTSVDGRTYRLSDFRGRPVMLWLFSTWCKTCRAATVAVARNYARLNRAGLQIIQLKLYDNMGYSGPSTEEFAAKYAGSIALGSGWLWGEASKAGSYVYNPKGYSEIYCLIDKDGILRDVAQAPNVTMEKIMRFARASSDDGLEQK